MRDIPSGTRESITPLYRHPYPPSLLILHFAFPSKYGPPVPLRAVCNAKFASNSNFIFFPIYYKYTNESAFFVDSNTGAVKL